MLAGAFITLLLLGTLSFSAPQSDARPVELGRVDWSRDFASAVDRAKEKKLPLLVLFQEVPG